MDENYLTPHTFTTNSTSTPSSWKTNPGSAPATWAACYASTSTNAPFENSIPTNTKLYECPSTAPSKTP